MELLGRYELILTQAMKELGPVEMPVDSRKALQVQGVLAPVLADIVYRLCIEHGIAFTPFRETIIDILAERKPAPVGTVTASGLARPFAAKLEPAHPLILLALEMMPADEPF